MLLAGCAPSLSNIPAEGQLAGQLVDTTVDSEIARYYLEHYLAGELVDSDMHARIRAVERNTRDAEFTRAELRRIGSPFSTDFATLLFARQLLQHSDNQAFYRAFQHETNRLTRTAAAGARLPTTEDPAYALLFAPGWLYVTMNSGADFARQREMLAEMGYATHLIAVDENGSVENNAALIADDIRQFSSKGEDMILVSVSKG